MFDFIGETISSAIDTVVENPFKTLAAVAVTIGTGGLALAYAPAIAGAAGGTGLLGAASTGTAISTLSGAALTNASLAAFGGGAVAAGGGGMALGTTVVASAGTVTGAVASGTAAALINKNG
jgi:hypothetical protein